MRVEFVSNELYENEGRNKGHQFKVGEQYDFTPAFAERWIRRELAVPVDGGENAVLIDGAGPFKPINARAQKVEPEPVPVAEPVKEAIKDAVKAVEPVKAPDPAKTTLSLPKKA